MTARDDLMRTLHAWTCASAKPDGHIDGYYEALADAVIREWLPTQQAAALREAADDLVALREVDGRPDWRAGPEECANWLRERAGKATA